MNKNKLLKKNQTTKKKGEPSGNVLWKKETNCELLFILFICLPHKRSSSTVHNVKITWKNCQGDLDEARKLMIE